MTVAFDNTMLSILLNPNCRVPLDSEGAPVSLAKERAQSVVVELEKARRKIILPAPACAELLTAIGPEAAAYISIVSRSRLFEIASFCARCASELAILNRGTFKTNDDRNGAEPYQKIKVDRQIIAICRVYGVTELYSDDIGLRNRAVMCGITVIRTEDIPLPAIDAQIQLDLQGHAEIPDGED